MDESSDSQDSIIKHKPLWASYGYGKDKKKGEKKKRGNLYRTYGTRVVPVYAYHSLSLRRDNLISCLTLIYVCRIIFLVSRTYKFVLIALNFPLFGL